MAEEEQDKAAKGADESHGEDVQGEAGGKKNSLVLWAGLAVAVLALAGGGAWFFMGGEELLQEEVAVEEEPAQKAPAIYYDFQPAFVVAFDVNGRQRMLQVSVSAMTREQDAIEGMDIHLPLIKSRLIMLFSGADYNGLKTPEGREALRVSALDTIQDVLQNEIGKPGIEQVFFTGFVMQ
jgi:flagellar FliL protein